MHRAQVHAVALAAGLALAGCAHRVTVHSEPPGARVWVDGRELGPAPVRFEEQPGAEPHRVHAELPGRTPVELLVERSELAWAPALGVLAGSALCSASLCALGALAANPVAIAGLCGGWLLACVNPTLGCQLSCAGCALLQVSPSLWTGGGMIAGGLLGWLPVASLWWLGLSPERVVVRFPDESTTAAPAGQAY